MRVPKKLRRPGFASLASQGLNLGQYLGSAGPNHLVVMDNRSGLHARKNQCQAARNPVEFWSVICHRCKSLERRPCPLSPALGATLGCGTMVLRGSKRRSTTESDTGAHMTPGT